MNPCSEDVYAVGVIAWRLYSGQCPWEGVLDTDLKGLVKVISQDAEITRILRSEKELSRKFLGMCLTASSMNRCSIGELLHWLTANEVGLTREWGDKGKRSCRNKKNIKFS